MDPFVEGTIRRPAVMLAVEIFKSEVLAGVRRVFLWKLLDGRFARLANFADRTAVPALGGLSGGRAACDMGAAGLVSLSRRMHPGMQGMPRQNQGRLQNSQRSGDPSASAVRIGAAANHAYKRLRPEGERGASEMSLMMRETLGNSHHLIHDCLRLNGGQGQGHRLAIRAACGCNRMNRSRERIRALDSGKPDAVFDTNS